MPRFPEDRTCGLILRAQILQANFQFYPSLSLLVSISAQANNLIKKFLRKNPEGKKQEKSCRRRGGWLG